MRSKQPHAVPDVAHHAYAQAASIVQEKGIQSFISVPLLEKEDVLGLLYVDYFQPHSFTEEDLRVIKLFANEAH